MITIKYESSLSEVIGLEGSVEHIFRNYFRYKNPKYNDRDHSRCLGEGTEYPIPEYVSYLFDDEFSTKIPTGLHWAVKKWSEKEGIKISFEGFPDKPGIDSNVSEDVLDGISLRPYQVEAIKIALKSGRGVMELSTGAGKSEIIIALTKTFDKKTLCVTPNQAAMNNLWSRFLKRGVDAGRLGDKKRDLDSKVLVAVINSIHSGLKRGDEEVKRVVSESGVFFSDECHHLPSPTYINVAASCPAPYRFFMSGTPFENNKIRDDPGELFGDDSWVIGLSDKVIYHIPPKKLIKMGYLSRGVFVSFPSLGPKIKTKFYPAVYDSGIVKNTVRNSAICRLLSNLVYLRRYPLVGVEKLDHGIRIQSELLQMGIPSACSYGNNVVHIPTKIATDFSINHDSDGQVSKINRSDFDVIQALKEGVIKVLIGSRIFDEAQDIPFLTDFINASGGKASQRLRQKIGRILRRSEGKTASWFWDPYDLSHFYLKNHSKARLKIAKEEDYIVIKDWLFSIPLCDIDISKIKGEVIMKETEIEVTVGMTIPLSMRTGSQFFVKPVVSLRGKLEDGDDPHLCAEILHHKVAAMYVKEVYRQSAIAGQIGSYGFDKTKDQVLEQAKQFLEGVK